MEKAKQSENRVNVYRDTDADGVPDRVDPQYTYPPAEHAKNAHEQEQQDKKSQEQKPRAPRRRR